MTFQTQELCVFQGLQHNTQTSKLVAKALTKMLQVNKTLTHLDLSGKNFSDLGAEVLAQYLKFRILARQD